MAIGKILIKNIKILFNIQQLAKIEQQAQEGQE